MTLQQILTGNINSQEIYEVIKKDLSFFSNNITHFIDTTTNRVKSISYITDEEKTELKYYYSEKVGRGIIPQKIELIGEKNKETIIKHTKNIFNQKQNIAFKIPASYVEKH